MRLTSTKKHAKYVNLLLYGKHGIGKTPLIATAPKPFIIDLDEGQLSNADLDIDMSIVRTFEEMEETYAYLNTKKASKKYETIVLDGGWELSDVVLEELKAVLEKEAKESGKKGFEPRRAYMQMAEVYKLWIRKFRDLPYNFILTTLASEIDIENAEKMRPHFAGNVLKIEIPGMFNEIFCLHYNDEDEEEEIVLQCKPDIDYDARDRSRALKRYEEKDLAVLFDKIQTKVNKNGKKQKGKGK